MKTPFLYFLLLSTSTLFAQLEEPDFQTTIYFKDAIGNQDSVTVGYDEFAEDFNPQFGEEDIEAPWDSVFEVRAARENDFISGVNLSLLQSKIIIATNEGGLHPTHNCLWINNAIVLLVKTKHLPLTVQWNQLHFDNSFCRIGTTISAHALPLTIGPIDWWYGSGNAEYTWCMAEDSLLTTDRFDVGIGGFYLLDEIEGIGQDTIQALLLNWRFENAIESPCPTMVSTDNINPSTPLLTISPNPTNGFVRINNNDFFNTKWKVFDNLGQILQVGQGSEINFTKHPNGVYFVQTTQNNRTYTNKVIKAN